MVAHPSAIFPHRCACACRCLAGWMFAGAVTGSVGMPFCMAAGTLAGGYRAVTGHSLLEELSKSATLPLPGRSAARSATTMPFQVALPPPPETGGCDKCAG